MTLELGIDLDEIQQLKQWHLVLSLENNAHTPTATLPLLYNTILSYVHRSSCEILPFVDIFWWK